MSETYVCTTEDLDEDSKLAVQEYLLLNRCETCRYWDKYFGYYFFGLGGCKLQYERGIYSWDYTSGFAFWNCCYDWQDQSITQIGV